MTEEFKAIIELLRMSGEGAFTLCIVYFLVPLVKYMIVGLTVVLAIKLFCFTIITELNTRGTKQCQI